MLNTFDSPYHVAQTGDHRNAELEKVCEKLSELVAQLEEMFRLVRSGSLTHGKIAHVEVRTVGDFAVEELQKLFANPIVQVMNQIHFSMGKSHLVGNKNKEQEERAELWIHTLTKTFRTWEDGSKRKVCSRNMDARSA